MEVLICVALIFGIPAFVTVCLNLIREPRVIRRAGLRPTNGFTDSRDCGWRRPSDV